MLAYNEEQFQDYADAQYAAEFGNLSAYEDNILLVFLTDKDYYDYYYIAWVGDHIVTDINYMFGNEYTELGKAISASVNTSSYKYSLDSNLAQAVDTMTQKIEALELETSFYCSEEHAEPVSHLVNKTEIPMTAETVNKSLEAFTEETGISIAVVVDDMENVFERAMPANAVITLVIAVALVALAVYLIVRAVRSKKDDGENGDYQQYNN